MSAAHLQASASTVSASALTSMPSDPPQVRKLKKAAADFEAMLLAKWWSSMKESGLGGEDDSTDPGHDTLDNMGIQAMSSAVASRGGLGIGSMLVRSLLSNAEEDAPKPKPPLLP
jgi:Rod binding domain-containing protein